MPTWVDQDSTLEMLPAWWRGNNGNQEDPPPLNIHASICHRSTSPRHSRLARGTCLKLISTFDGAASAPPASAARHHRPPHAKSAAAPVASPFSLASHHHFRPFPRGRGPASQHRNQHPCGWRGQLADRAPHAALSLSLLLLQSEHHPSQPVPRTMKLASASPPSMLHGSSHGVS